MSGLRHALGEEGVLVGVALVDLVSDEGRAAGELIHCTSQISR